MKRLFFISLAAAFLLGACRKADNPKIPTLARVPVPQITVDKTKSVSISATNPASFSGAFSVGLFFPNDIKPSKMDVVVRKNNNNSNVKLFSAGVTTWPSTFTITGTQLATIFGATPVLGDQYDFGVDIYTQDGTKYEAFPAVGAGYGAGVSGQYGGVNLVASYGVLCLYDPNIYQGNFVVVQDDWADTNPGDIIVLTKVDNTTFSFKYASTLLNPVPQGIIVNVDPLTNIPSITKQTVGSGWTYDGSKPVTIRTLSNAANILTPCEGGVSLVVAWSQGSGEYGPVFFKLKKQ